MSFSLIASADKLSILAVLASFGFLSLSFGSLGVSKRE
jgi:hypothetical protein